MDTMANDDLIEFRKSRHDSGIFSTMSMVLASMELASKLQKQEARDLLCIMSEPKCVQRRVYGESNGCFTAASVFPLFLYL